MAKTLEKMYICVGENCVGSAELGYCGATHSLKIWLEILFPNVDAVSYFDGDTAKTIIDYILKHTGKKLIAI